MSQPGSMQRRRRSPRPLPNPAAPLFALLLAAFCSRRPGASFAQAPNISATLDDGVPAGTYKQNGDTLTYTTVITNSGAGDATGVTLTEPTPADTTLVPGSVHASPLANHDAYTAVGNTKLYVGVAAPAGEPALELSAGQALFANDQTITDTNVFVSNTSPANGSVTVNTNGTFVYTPNVGFTGSNSFTYTLQQQRRRDAHRHRHGVDHRQQSRLVREQCGRGRQRHLDLAVQLAGERQRRGRRGRQRRGERLHLRLQGQRRGLHRRPAARKRADAHQRKQRAGGRRHYAARRAVGPQHPDAVAQRRLDRGALDRQHDRRLHHHQLAGNGISGSTSARRRSPTSR